MNKKKSTILYILIWTTAISAVIFVWVFSTFNESTLMSYTFVGDITTDRIDVLELIQKQNPNAMFFLGDLGYYTPDNWFDFTSNLDKNKTFIALGNHDLRNAERNEWFDPYGLTNSTYSVDFENVHFLILDTEEQTYKEFLSFIEDDLDHSQKKWKIILMHKEIYTDSKRNPKIEIRENVQPIFDKYGVDLVIQAHAHVYERTMPLKFNGTISDEGQQYITVGTGGRHLQSFDKKSEWNLVQYNENFGILKLEISDHIIIGKFITINDELIDNFTIRK